MDTFLAVLTVLVKFFAVFFLLAPGPNFGVEMSVLKKEDV